MSCSRRKFVQSVTFVGVFAAVPSLLPQIAFGQKIGGPGRPAPGDALSALSSEDFYRQLTTQFRVTVGSQQTYCDLYTVEVMTTVEKHGLDCFLLVFRGMHESQIPQGTYQFSHSKLGAFNLFITPGGLDGRMCYYNAIINRLPH